MITTSGKHPAGKASAGQGSNGTNGRFGLKTKLSAGVVTLGCAAALILGGLRMENAAQPQPQIAPQATQLSAGTDDLATTGCIGTAGPFACQVGQSLAGTDDFATTGCVQVPGPFACATALPTVTYGTDDFATNWCSQTPGPFACPTSPVHQER